MAGGAGTYRVNDTTGYASIAAAMTQLIADEDGAPFSASQEIVVEKNTTESAAVRYPLIAEACGTVDNPLIIRGDAQSPRRIWTRTGSCLEVVTGIQGYLIIRDMEITNANGQTAYIIQNDGVAIINTMLHLDRCVLRRAATGVMRLTWMRNYLACLMTDCIGVNIALRGAATAGYGSVRLLRCRMSLEGQIDFSAGNSSYELLAYNSAFLVPTTILSVGLNIPKARMRLDHCTIKSTSGGYILEIPDAASSLGGHFLWQQNLTNCIIDGAKGLHNSTAAGFDTMPIIPAPIGEETAGNIWSNMTDGANKFINYTGTLNDVATLEAWQARGFEIGSTRQNVTFLSTDPESTDFLRVASLPNTSRNCGHFIDAFGTDRSAIFVAPGHYQETARTLALTTVSGGGSYRTANLVPNNVLAPNTFGVDETGDFDKDAYAVAFENGRNSGLVKEDLRDGVDVLQKGVLIEGDCIVPAAADVREGAPVDHTLGTLELGSPPAVPTLTATVVDGEGAIFAIAGYDFETVNELFISIGSTGVFTSYGSTWIADQMEVDLDAGLYWADVTSTSGGGTSRSELLRVVVTASGAATDNIALAKKVMKARAVYWAKDGTSDLGQPTYAAPVEVPCRWDENVAELVSALGEKFTSSAKAIVDRDMTIGGVLMLGTIDDVTNVSSPKENANAWEIKSAKKTANIKGKKYIREVFV